MWAAGKYKGKDKGKYKGEYKGKTKGKYKGNYKGKCQDSGTQKREGASARGQFRKVPPGGFVNSGTQRCSTVLSTVLAFKTTVLNGAQRREL